MGCGVNIRVLPITAQRAIRAKGETGSLILSLSQFDQNYEWYYAACEKLHGSAMKSLTLNFDTKVELPSNPRIDVHHFKTTSQRAWSTSS